MTDAKGGISPGFSVQYLPMMVCASCKGDCVGDRGCNVHINRGDKPHEWREVCSTCSGRGTVVPTDLKAHADFIRKFRINIGLSLRDHARELGITALELSSVERGEAVLMRESGDG